MFKSLTVAVMISFAMVQSANAMPKLEKTKRILGATTAIVLGIPQDMMIGAYYGKHNRGPGFLFEWYILRRRPSMVTSRGSKFTPGKDLLRMPVDTLHGIADGVKSGARWGRRYGYEQPFSSWSLNKFAVQSELMQMADGGAFGTKSSSKVFAELERIEKEEKRGIDESTNKSSE